MTTFCTRDKATTEQRIEYQLNGHDTLSTITIDDPDSRCNIDALFEQIALANVLALDATILKREFRLYLRSYWIVEVRRAYTFAKNRVKHE